MFRFSSCRFFILICCLCTATITLAQGTFYSNQSINLSEYGDSRVDSMPTVTETAQFIFYFASDYQAQAAILTADQLSAFKKNQAYSAIEVFDKKTGYASVELPPGEYYFGVRNVANGANSCSVEIDLFDGYKPEGSTYKQAYINGAEAVGKNGGYLVHDFTIEEGYSYTIDGVNTGLKFYILPRSEKSNFTNRNQFQYLSDFSKLTEERNMPGYYHLNIPPGSYTLGFYNDSEITHSTTYLMLIWSNDGGVVGGMESIRAELGGDVRIPL